MTFGAVTDWIRAIIVFMLLLSVLLHLLPDEKYKSYMRIFAGFVLLLLVTEPVRNGSLGNALADIFSDGEMIAGQEREWETRVEEIRGETEAAGRQTVLAAYRQQIEESIAGFLSERGYELQAVDVALTEDGVQRLSVCVTQMQAAGDDADAEAAGAAGSGGQNALNADNTQEKLLRDALCEAYQMESPAVSVEIRGR